MDESKELATKSSATVEADDLLFEILLRLPIQSIQRFITTCKQWQSLMTLPRFRKLWRKRNLKPATGIFLRYQKYEPFITSQSYLTYLVPFSPNKPITRVITRFEKNACIIQSCNGLLLCSTGDFLAHCVYFVYNPATEKYHALPRVYGFDDGTPQSVSLAFDPNKSPHYKVIYFHGYKSCVHVYSSDTRCWKSIAFYESYTPSYWSRGVYWNGAIHWFGGVYFDIENEKFNTMSTLTLLYNQTTCYYFGESCDRLIYIGLCKTELAGSYSVNELKRDYSEWVIKYRVELNGEYSILSVVYGVEDDGSFLVLKKGKRIVQYNLLSKTYEELNSPTGDYVNGTAFAFPYIESLCGV